MLKLPLTPLKTNIIQENEYCFLCIKTNFSAYFNINFLRRLRFVFPFILSCFERIIKSIWGISRILPEASNQYTQYLYPFPNFYRHENILVKHQIINVVWTILDRSGNIVLTRFWLISKPISRICSFDKKW